MQATELGTTGEQISAIGFGAMRLSLEGRPAPDVALRVIHAALDAGVTLIDTADVYCLDDEDIGHNERLVGTVVRQRPDRDRLRIASKAGMRRPGGAWTRDGSPTHIRQSCEQTLRALGVDQIFLYQLHAPDGQVSFETTMEAFAELQREGKCAHLGLSNVKAAHIVRAAAIADVVSVQNRLSPYYRESITGGVVADCERRGITFLAYRPLGGHRLTTVMRGFSALEAIAQRRAISTHQVALAWVRAAGPRVVPLAGATKPEHAIDSARAADVVLTADEVEAIDKEPWIQNVRFCSL